MNEELHDSIAYCDAFLTVTTRFVPTMGERMDIDMTGNSQYTYPFTTAVYSD
jgi:hypothetical protein